MRNILLNVSSCFFDCLIVWLLDYLNIFTQALTHCSPYYFDSSAKRIDGVTSWRCLARHSEQALSALTLYIIEVYFIPFWILFVSTLRGGGRSNPERTQNEGRANPKWRQPSVIIIPKRTKSRVQLFRKKRLLTHSILPFGNFKNRFFRLIRRRTTLFVLQCYSATVIVQVLLFDEIVYMYLYIKYIDRLVVFW